MIWNEKCVKLSSLSKMLDCFALVSLGCASHTAAPVSTIQAIHLIIYKLRLKQIKGPTQFIETIPTDLININLALFIRHILPPIDDLSLEGPIHRKFYQMRNDSAKFDRRHAMYRIFQG
jgi:hypothetical protein